MWTVGKCSVRVMLPEIIGSKLTDSPWNVISFERVLIYYDGPRLVLQRSRAGQLFLAWWNDSDEYVDRWVYLPLSAVRLHAVLSGSMPSLDALNNPEDGYLLVVDIDLETDSVVKTIMTTAEFLPHSSLPHEGARLNIPIPEEITGLHARERAHLLDVRIENGMESHTGRIGADIVGRLVGNLQRLLDAIGQAIWEEPTSTGPISNAVRERTRLDIVGAYAGSLGLLFETNKEDDLHGNSLARNSLEGLFDLLEASDEDIQQKVLSPRVAKNYSVFLSTIETPLSVASLRWSRPGDWDSRQSSITKESARNIKSKIQAVSSYIQDNLHLQGVIISGNIRTRRFQFRESGTGDRFGGRIHRQLASRANYIPLGSICRVILQPDFQVNEVTGEERLTYTLLSIVSL